MFEESVASTPSFWAVLYSWFTPTVFFVLLQLMIGTIFITSTFTNHNNKHHHNHDTPTHNGGDQQQHPPQLARSPSVLHRLKSINLYPYRSQDSPPPFLPQQQPPLSRSPSMLQRLKSINLYNYFPTDPISTHFTHDSQHPIHHLDDDPQEEEEEEEEHKDQVGEIPNPQPDRTIDEIYTHLQEGHVTRTMSDTKPASGELPEKLPRKMKKSASSKSAFAHFKEDDIVENRRPATVKEAKVSESEADSEVDAKADDFINKFKQQLKLQRMDSIMRYKEVIHRGTEK